MIITAKSSNFTDNIGSSIQLLHSHLLCESVIFINNIADNGAALYIDQRSYITIGDGATVQFINNLAVEHGGAIYINTVYNCPGMTFSYNNSEVLFVNNMARISGNSRYVFLYTCIL